MPLISPAPFVVAAFMSYRTRRGAALLFAGEMALHECRCEEGERENGEPRRELSQRLSGSRVDFGAAS